MWSTAHIKEALTRLDKECQNQWSEYEGSSRDRMHKVLGASQVCPEKGLFGISDSLSTASNKRTHFPAASVTLELEGKKLKLDKYILRY